MEAKFKIGDSLVIVEDPNETRIGKKVVVIDVFHYYRMNKSKLSAVEKWEYKVTDGVKSLGWIDECYLDYYK